MSTVPCSNDDFCMSQFMITPNEFACCASELAVSRIYAPQKRYNYYCYYCYYNAYIDKTFYSAVPCHPGKLSSYNSLVLSCGSRALLSSCLFHQPSGQTVAVTHTTDDPHADEGFVQKAQVSLTSAVQHNQRFYVSLWAHNKVT